MKLLGWMHRKLRQNTNETTPKDFPIDDMLQCYQKGNHGTKTAPFGKAQRGNNYPNSFEHPEDDDITIDLFHGFLTIGTLGGTEQFSTRTQPSTPTFSISEKETTENELKLINDELEKLVLQGDNDDDDDIDVRISCCSAVTLSGKPNIESADTCPLQSYLFGSAVDCTAPPPPPQQAKKEQRTSLGDLFQKTNKHHHRDEEAKNNDKSAVHVVKKMLKKTIDSDKKLHKIRQMFNRKVHPAAENPTATGAGANFCPTKAPTKSNNYVVGSRSDHHTEEEEDIIIYPQQQQQQQAASDKATPKDDIIRCCKTQSLTTGNHEFWVKTDADYLVLEL